jgi:hypothetical protein
MDYKSVKEYYFERRVIERFLFRNYVKEQGTRLGVSQAEIYFLFENFCREKKVPLISENMLGRLLAKIPGLIRFRRTNNLSWWSGLTPRATPYEGPIEPAQLAAFTPVADVDDEKEKEKFHRADYHWTPPARPVGDATLKGFPWTGLERCYRELQLIPEFRSTQLVYDEADPPSKYFVEQSVAVWEKFDRLCQARGVPTCSRHRLRILLNVRQSVLYDGSKVWWPIRLKESYDAAAAQKEAVRDLPSDPSTSQNVK